MAEDDPEPDPKPDTRANPKNTFEKKSSSVFHTFLGTPTSKEKRTTLQVLTSIVPKVPQ
jgi:hypothetical protein